MTTKKQPEKTEKESMLEDILRFLKSGAWWKLPLFILALAIAYRLAFSTIFIKNGNKELNLQSVKPSELK